MFVVISNPLSISWQKSLFNLYSLQNRLFRSFFVSDFRKSFYLQKLILKSNFSRLLAIREVTQLSPYKKIPGSDGKISLTFTERFELGESLRFYYSNWYPKSSKTISVIKSDGSLSLVKLPVISDRVWQLLISYSLEPVYESLFHPHSFGFRTSCNVFNLQEFLFFNFSAFSNSDQKRVLIVDFEKIFVKFDNHFFLKNIFAPRGVKLGIFRSFANDFSLDFVKLNSSNLSLSSLFANIAFNGINDIHLSLRFGYSVLFILKPCDNEKEILNKVFSYLIVNRLNADFKVVGIFSTLSGFNFLDWNYYFSLSKGLIIKPTLDNYYLFLKRVKRILNNSNYGSYVKALKLFPIVKEWKIYNKFCSLSDSRFSLFHIKKRAFKIFNKESKQDSYSVKKLLDKSFCSSLKFIKSDIEVEIEKSPYYGHNIFNYAFKFNPVSKRILSTSSKKKALFYFNLVCIHCGLKLSN